MKKNIFYGTALILLTVAAVMGLCWLIPSWAANGLEIILLLLLIITVAASGNQRRGGNGKGD